MTKFLPYCDEYGANGENEIGGGMAQIAGYRKPAD